MYYKTKKQLLVSSLFQANLFRHYRRILAPLNFFNTIFQHWLILVSGILLGYALLNSTFIIFGLSFIWCFWPEGKQILWYTPVSLTFWIFVLSFLSSLYSLKVCLTLPKEFRILLIVEQGVSLKFFLKKGVQTQKKTLFILLIFLIFFFFPKNFNWCNMVDAIIM